MNHINGLCSRATAFKLDAFGHVRANVNGCLSIVWGNAWIDDPQKATSEELRQYVCARAVEPSSGVLDMDAEGTPRASQEAQELINSVKWEPWPEN